MGPGVGDQGLSRTRGMTLDWRGVHLSTPDKKILTNVSGSASGGHLCCVMGPSGAGKTSLLNVLSGRRANDGSNIRVTGDISVGGAKIDPTEFKGNLAYVMQQDALVPTATPREALGFSASLRLGVSGLEKDDLIQSMIEDLQLLDCADTMLSECSGGERKRTSVGVELIIKPMLVFCDEPTSGLDSESALSCVNLLRFIATQRDAAVLCTIHQPSSKVFGIFDHVIILKDGRVLFQGKTQDIATHFGAAGYALPLHHNPADFVMDISVNTPDHELQAAGLFSAMDVSHEHEDKKDAPVSQIVSLDDVLLHNHHMRRAGFCVQMYWLVHREVMTIVRNPRMLRTRFGLISFINFLLGVMCMGAGGRDRANGANLTSYFGALTIATMSSMFASAQPVMLSFPLDRPIFMREYNVGTYSSLSYFLAKTALEVWITRCRVLVY